MATFDPSEVEVVDAPKARKSFDPSDVEVVNDEHKVGLSGPGSKDETPNDLIVSPTPSTMMPSPYAMPGINALDAKGATEGLKTLGSIAGGELGGAGVRAIPAVAKLAGGASAVGKVAAGAAEGAGAGAGASVGAGETSPKKIAENALIGGTLGGAAPLAVRAGERAIARTENKLVDEIATGARDTVRKDLGEQREVLKRIAKTDKPALRNTSDAESLVESTQKAIEKRMALNDAKYAAHDLKSPGIVVSIGEMQDGVSNIAAELSKNPAMVRTVVPKLEALSKDILAFGDPSEFVTARQARQLATDWQKVAAGGAEGAEETATQEASRNAANAVIKVLDKHTGGDPEIKRLNEEISALLDANKAAKQRYRTENQAGRVNEGSLRHAPQIVKDFSHGAVAGVARTGFRVAHAAFENKDAALAGIAKMVRAGETVTQADIDAAIKAGAKAASVNAIVNGGKND